MDFAHPNLVSQLYRGYDGWEGRLWLPTWQGYVGMTEPPSDGIVNVVFQTTEGEEEIQPIRVEQIKAIEYVLGNPEMYHAFLLETLAEYREKLRQNDPDNDPESPRYFPRLQHLDDLKRQVCLTHVVVSRVSKDGIAYVGLCFDNVWDDEHGVGILAHQNVAVSVGDYQTAYSKPQKE